MLTEVATGFGATGDLEAAALTLTNLRHGLNADLDQLVTLTPYEKENVERLQRRIVNIEEASQRAGNPAFDYVAVACNHWKKIKRLIPEITSTTSSTDTVYQWESPEWELYRWLGVSAEAEKRVLGHQVLCTSFQQFSRYPLGFPENHVGIPLSGDTKGLIRASLYLLFILQTMARSSSENARFFFF